MSVEASEEPVRVTSAWLREAFPEARMVCICPSQRDACPGWCERMKAGRQAIREWLGE